MSEAPAPAPAPTRSLADASARGLAVPHRAPRGKLAWALASLLLAAGCASPPPPRAMVIIPSAPMATSEANEATTAASIALSPLRLPEHWQRRQVLHLRHDAELAAWPNAVWAERVETGMTRRFSQALRRHAPAFGWWPGDDALSPRRLLVEVQQLDVRAGAGEVAGTLSWRLVDRQGRLLDGGNLSGRLQAPIADAQQEADALARWLDSQAQALAARLQGPLPR